MLMSKQILLYMKSVNMFTVPHKINFILPNGMNITNKAHYFYEMSAYSPICFSLTATLRDNITITRI
jgi:hypothetical protein